MEYTGYRASDALRRSPAAVEGHSVLSRVCFVLSVIGFLQHVVVQQNDSYTTMVYAESQIDSYSYSPPFNVLTWIP